MKSLCAPHPASGRAGRPYSTGLRPGKSAVGGSTRPRGFATLRARPLCAGHSARADPVPPGAPGE
ncbi:paREP13 [Pyrobaculum oguniense TE7]|uniref:PaREP13 n=1 Tax=Pyrobaculum oguniense (strain DSM 13380 / JCM 10595 / TE7) TaxID=698757 RepID=H6QCX9_PYROT|nr:paREP13 [Pyrobaculum oguniense TE7]